MVAPVTTEIGVQWRSWHLHLGSTAQSLADRVIQDVVGPTVRELPDRPWFFIRYWQGGPHVRLRIGDLDAPRADAVERSLADRLDSAGKLTRDEEPVTDTEYRSDADRFAAGEHGVDSTVGELLAPGVHSGWYAPEYDRYGGRDLMPATERLFQLSSELVLRLLPHLTTANARASAALRGTIAAATALDDPAAYYARSTAVWREWGRQAGCTTAQLDQLCAFDDKPAANPIDPSRHGPFAPWHAAIADLTTTIRDRTTVPPQLIVFSHVHMLQNRLGRSLFEELRSYAWLAKEVRS